MRIFLSASGLIIIVVLLGALGIMLYMMSNLLASAPSVSTTVLYTSTANPLSNYTTILSTSTIPSVSNNYTTNDSIILFTLRQINQERAKFGVANVTLSPITSAPQHASSMLYYGYFSHWDPFGMKPYMRYTLVGGNESVDENVAYNEQVNETCLGPICSIIPINVTAAITRMDNQMLYNDSACCNNGHRNNTLDPNHNQVSIGVAYNKTTVYLVQDFINNYIIWLNNTPGVVTNDPVIYLDGITTGGANFSFIQVNYDPMPTHLNNTQLSATKSYDNGEPVAGVAYGPYYYQNVQTIYATQYDVANDHFNVHFNLSSVIKNYGAGVYTIDLYLTNSTGGKFLGTTYSIFINNNSEAYVPENV